MSGGPQVFLGATTFCLIATPPDLRPPRGAPVGIGLLGMPVGGGPPARRPRCELRSARRLEARPGPAAAHGHRSGSRRLRGVLRSGGADPVSVRPRRRPRAPQPGPAGLAVSSDRAALILFRLGPAAAHGHRSGSRRLRGVLRSGGLMSTARPRHSLRTAEYERFRHSSCGAAPSGEDN